MHTFLISSGYKSELSFEKTYFKDFDFIGRAKCDFLID